MKLRSAFLAFASLLLIAPLASADEASTPAANAQVAAAIFADPASPDCADAELSWLERKPSERSVACGACSQPLCVGKQFGQYCKFQNGRFYYCQPAYVVCDPDDCQCWTGPLP